MIARPALYGELRAVLRLNLKDSDQCVNDPEIVTVLFSFLRKNG